MNEFGTIQSQAGGAQDSLTKLAVVFALLVFVVVCLVVPCSLCSRNLSLWHIFANISVYSG